MFRRIGLILLLLLGGFVLISLSCGKKSTEPSKPEVCSLTRISGNKQERTPGTALDPFLVLVTDDKGQAVKGRRVDFEILQGDGKFSVESALTDVSGQASTVLTLGDLMGPIQVQATLFGYDESVVFTATVSSADIIISEAAVEVGGEDVPFQRPEIEGDRVTFAVEGPSPQIKVGDILVNTTEPYFFKRVVRVVSQDTTELSVETTQASLTEVIEEASIEEMFSVPSSLRRPAGLLGYGVNFDGTTLVSDSRLNLSIPSGGIDFDPEFEFKLEIDDWEMQEFRLTAGGELSAQLELLLEAYGSVSVGKEKTIAKFPPQPYHITLWAGYIPIVVGLQTEFNVGVLVGVGAAGTIRSGFSVTKEVRIGAAYADGQWSHLKGSDPQWEAGTVQTDLECDATLRGYVEAQINVDFYDVAGPHFGVQPYGELTTTIDSQKLTWELATGLDAYVGVHVEILDHNLADWNHPFQWVRVPIKDGEIVFNQPPVAHAGSDQTVTVGTEVTLDGSGSSDPDEDALTCQWTQTGGPTVTLSGATTAAPKFTPTDAGPYVFSLVVNDGQVDSEADEVTVIVQAVTEMALIPAGFFQMGDAFSEGRSDERPVHTVYVDAFYMDMCEVTNAQYCVFLSDQGNQTEGGDTWLDIGSSYCLISKSGDQFVPESGYEDHPVIEVTWYGARAYAGWAGKRLPTEAEWEKAARGGLEANRYPWGDEAPVCQDGASNGARFWDNGVCNDIGTALIGSYSPNGYGLYDMAGNVWEWCNDWYDSGYYSESPENNPTGSAIGTYRVLRGGSWNHGPSFMRCAGRGDSYCYPVESYGSVGFRCVRSSP